MEQLREKLKELRHRKDWSQENLAREVGVSLSTIQRWEAKGGKPYCLARRELQRLFRGGGDRRRGIRRTRQNLMLWEASRSSQGRGSVTTAMLRRFPSGRRPRE